MDRNGKTALINACEKQNVELVKELLHKEVEINQKANDGNYLK